LPIKELVKSSIERMALVLSAPVVSAGASLVGSVVFSICVVCVRTHSAERNVPPILIVGACSLKSAEILTTPRQSVWVGG